MFGTDLSSCGTMLQTWQDVLMDAMVLHVGYLVDMIVVQQAVNIIPALTLVQIIAEVQVALATATLAVLQAVTLIVQVELH